MSEDNSNSTPESDPENWIEITDDAGEVIHRINIDLCNQVADEFMMDMADLEEHVDNYDFVTACFGLFVNSMHVLHDAGWSVEDLMREVKEHVGTEQITPEDVSDNRTLN
jgi:hypothetical protein